jgi:hypothetical protein
LRNWGQEPLSGVAGTKTAKSTKGKEFERKCEKGEEVTQVLDMSKTIALLKESKG